MACAVDKVCTYHSYMTVCSMSNLDEKCEWLKKENTGVAVLNSPNSIQCQFYPRILSNTTKEARSQGTEGARTNNWAPEERERYFVAMPTVLLSEMGVQKIRVENLPNLATMPRPSQKVCLETTPT